MFLVLIKQTKRRIKMKIKMYKKIEYNENSKENNPELYYKNGNRKCEHVDITDKKVIENIIKLSDKPINIYNNMSLSILWNLPRKEYDENFMWVCMSGFLYDDNKPFVPNNFVVSDNIRNDKNQQIAYEIISYINQEIENKNKNVVVRVSI